MSPVLRMLPRWAVMIGLVVTPATVVGQADCLRCEDGPHTNCGYNSSYHYEEPGAIYGYHLSGQSGGYCHAATSSCAMGYHLWGCVASLTDASDEPPPLSPSDVALVLDAVWRSDHATIARYASGGMVKVSAARGVLLLLGCHGRPFASVRLAPALGLALQMSGAEAARVQLQEGGLFERPRVAARR